MRKQSRDFSRIWLDIERGFGWFVDQVRCKGESTGKILLGDNNRESMNMVQALKGPEATVELLYTLGKMSVHTICRML